MPRHCSECTRANPSSAAFCWFDGVPLDGGAVVPGESTSINYGVWAFPNPFVFPSGASCRNFLQFALACQRNPQEAADVLQQGFFESFFSLLGRTDLAMIARNAAKTPDRDRGLDELLGKIPGAPLEPPILHVEPDHKDFGVVLIGDERRFELTLTNKKDRLLYGKASVDNCPWLVLGDAGTPEKLFQFFDKFTLPVRIVGDRLRAYAKPQKVEIVIESNGGNATVVVQVLVPVKPFPEGVLSGAMSPRQLAEKAKAHPKDAAALLENGVVKRWYESNGWTYPVQGPTATGIAAVQQLFEVLGFVKIPKVELSEPAIALRGKPGQRLEYVVTAMTQEKRAAVAFAVSDQPWLVVGKSGFQGQMASIPLTVTSVPDQPGTTLTACLKVTANGSQRFDVPVTLNIEGDPYLKAPPPNGPPIPEPEESSVITLAPEMLAPAPVMAQPAPVSVPLPTTVMNPETVVAVPAPVPVAIAAVAAPTGTPPTRLAIGPWIMRLLPLAIVFLGLMVAVGRDLFSGGDPPETEPVVDWEHPVLALKFHDEIQGPNDPMQVATMRFGLGLPDPKDAKKFQTKLIFDDFGRTCNVCVRVDNMPPEGYLWGVEPGKGTWRPKRADLGKDLEGHRLIGAQSTWALLAPPITIKQYVEIVPGGLSDDGKTQWLDTCLIYYDIINDDSSSHSVGLRFLLDTYIGSNDAVPFTIPGAKELCDTYKVFGKPSEVPDYISALERQDLKNSGTVAHVTLRYSDGLEPPTRVILGAWPLRDLLNEPGGATAAGPNTKWDVPALSMKLAKRPPLNPDGDSAVTLYWDDAKIEPGKTRKVGFAYGLGSVSGQKGSGQLGLTAGGELVKDKEFTLTAYVKNPAPGTKVTLTLPRNSGLVLTDGKETEDVPALPSGSASPFSPVTWHVKASKGGVFTVKAALNNGAKDQHKIFIKQKAEVLH